MSGDRLPATAFPHLRLALSIDDSVAGVLELLGVPAVPGAESLRPGVLPLSGSPGVEIVLADPWDVPVLVERGAADAGVAPKHVLAELRPDLFEVLDLRVAEKRLVYVTPASSPQAAAPPASAPPSAAAAPAASSPAPGRRLRLATAHPRLTRAHFERTGVQVETLALRSAAELAAALGAADGAVVLLPPGERETTVPGARPAAEGAQTAVLSVQAEVLRSSARLIVNRSARAVRAAEVGLLVETLREAVRSRASGHTEAAGPTDAVRPGGAVAPTEAAGPTEAVRPSSDH